MGNAYTRDKEVVPPTLGQERELIFELKYISDVGIIGFPSVGKSSLLNALTGAGAKTGAYHFTTKNPVIGALADLEIVLADMPGLIEGAHKGKGLGDKFLRHIERTKVLLHVIDISNINEPEDVAGRFAKINEEMRLYNPDLLKKPQIIVFNKVDLIENKDLLNRYGAFFGDEFSVVYTSAVNGDGMDLLLEKVKEKLDVIEE